MVVGHNLSSGNFGCTEFHNEYYFVATKRLCCFKLRIIKTVNYCFTELRPHEARTFEFVSVPDSDYFCPVCLARSTH